MVVPNAHFGRKNFVWKLYAEIFWRKFYILGTFKTSEMLSLMTVSVNKYVLLLILRGFCGSQYPNSSIKVLIFTTAFFRPKVLIFSSTRRTSLTRIFQIISVFNWKLCLLSLKADILADFVRNLNLCFDLVRHCLV